MGRGEGQGGPFPHPTRPMHRSSKIIGSGASSGHGARHPPGAHSSLAETAHPRRLRAREELRGWGGVRVPGAARGVGVGV